MSFIYPNKRKEKCEEKLQLKKKNNKKKMMAKLKWLEFLVGNLKKETVITYADGTSIIYIILAIALLWFLYFTMKNKSNNCA